MLTSILNAITNFRSMALTIVCLCGALTDTGLHYFEVWSHWHDGSLKGYIAVFLLGVVTLALVWVTREHYATHKRAKRITTGAKFETPDYHVRLWDGMRYYWEKREFKIDDDARFQNAIDILGYIPTATSQRVIESWEKSTGQLHKLI